MVIGHDQVLNMHTTIKGKENTERILEFFNPLEILHKGLVNSVLSIATEGKHIIKDPLRRLSYTLSNGLACALFGLVMVDSDRGLKSTWILMKDITSCP